MAGEALVQQNPLQDNYYICVVVGGDKSAALNNLPAWRRSAMRDLKVQQREWKALILLASLTHPLPPYPSLSLDHFLYRPSVSIHVSVSVLSCLK